MPRIPGSWLGALDAAPRNWWRRQPPKRERLCYRKKSDALRLFLDANVDTVESWGGAGRRESCAEFDSVNHHYSGKGRPCARSIAQAAWLALRGSGQGAGPPFRLPDSAEDAMIRREEERYYEEQAIDSGEIDDCHTAWRNGRGRFRKGRGIKRKRVRKCVCRNARGHFKKCRSGEACTEEAPF